MAYKRQSRRLYDGRQWDRQRLEANRHGKNIALIARWLRIASGIRRDQTASSLGNRIAAYQAYEDLKSLPDGSVVNPRIGRSAEHAFALMGPQR